MSTAPYVAVATLLDRVHSWWEERRLARRLAAEADWLDRVENAAVLAGVVPDPWLVSGPPDGEALAMPSEQAESRPEDLDDCPRCEGLGMFVSYEGPDGRDAGYRTCSWCSGTGQRGAA